MLANGLEQPRIFPKKPTLLICGRGALLFEVSNDGLGTFFDEIRKMPTFAIDFLLERTGQAPVDGGLSDEKEYGPLEDCHGVDGGHVSFQCSYVWRISPKPTKYIA